jgi:hypothetical protein
MSAQGITIIERTGTATGTSTATATATAESSISPEAQAVLDRMSALDATEEQAIIDLVNGLVTEGLWSDVSGWWGLALNGTDYLTDWVDDVSPLVITGTAPHTKGSGIDFNINSYARTPNNFETYINTYPSCAYVQAQMTQSSGTANTDFFGMLNAGLEVYMRYRGTDTNDYNVTWGQAGVSPRPSFTLDPLNQEANYVTGGNSSIEVYSMVQTSTTQTNSRTAEGFPSGHPFQFNGRNSSGVSQQARGGIFRIAILANWSSTEVETAKPYIDQFLTDIGALP